MLAKTQGVNKLVVVINKLDDPTVNWSQYVSLLTTSAGIPTSLSPCSIYRHGFLASVFLLRESSLP